MMSNLLNLDEWFRWLAAAVTENAKLPSNASRQRRAARRMQPIIQAAQKALDDSDSKYLTYTDDWEKTLLILNHPRMHASTVVAENAARSLGQTERIGIMALLAYVQAKSAPVEAVRQAIAKGCAWTFHRINARVDRFLSDEPRKQFIALCSHYEAFKSAADQDTRAAAMNKIKSENPGASEFELLPECRESAKLGFTSLTDIEEKQLQDLLRRSRTFKSRGRRPPRSARGRSRRPARHAKEAE